MLGIGELKEKIDRKSGKILCPVINCKTEINKMTRYHQKRLKSWLTTGTNWNINFREDYFCNEHKIYISPTTFTYENIKDNFLWDDDEDRVIFNNLKMIKRFDEFRSPNCEDAVSWNVFRFLQKSNELDGFLTEIIGMPVSNAKVIYWSLDGNKTWDKLAEARREFREGRGSEPDLIVISDTIIFFIEAKLFDSNEKMPRNNNSEGYATGGNKWFLKVFTSNYEEVAIIAKKYELMRFWLLGTWVAEELKRDFYLVSLVLEEQDKDIEEIFRMHLNIDKERQFIRMSWEDIYRYILNTELSEGDKKNKEKILTYFRNKAFYNTKGNLQKVFSIL